LVSCRAASLGKGLSSAMRVPMLVTVSDPFPQGGNPGIILFVARLQEPGEHRHFGEILQERALF
jgi:hypothetical protein